MKGNTKSKRRWRFLWGRLNASLWFVPTLLAVASLLLYTGTQYLDLALVTDVSELSLIFSGGPDAARSVLGSISGAIITVAATSFSLAIVVLQLASSQYTPRVMQNFLADRGIQVVLGMFVGTFTYSLLVLRTIRTPVGATEVFVPVISLTTAVTLALVCVGLLIYFIHHVADLIKSSTVVQSAHRDSIQAIENLEDLENHEKTEDTEDEPTFPQYPGREPLTLLSRRSGYVQYLDLDAIAEASGSSFGPLESSKSRDSSNVTVYVDIPFGPGIFVPAGMPLARLWIDGDVDDEKDEGNFDAGLIEKVRKSFVLGKERSFQQDFTLGLRQLADIALLGLSPGVNDPTSAMQAMDRIEAILISLANKRLPRRLQKYQYGNKKVVLQIGYYSFDDMVGLGLDQIRRSAFTSGQVAVLDRFLKLVDRAIRANEPPERRHSLWERALAVARLAPQEITDPRDAANLMLHAVEVASPLLETPLREKVHSDLLDLVRFSEGLPGADRVQQKVEGAFVG